jgi:DNA polymerase III alpha subunit
MVNQKSSGEKIAGLEMADLEALGHVKFDILGINLLDKIMKIKELINGKS